MEVSTQLQQKIRANRPLLKNMFANVEKGHLPCANCMYANILNTFYECYTQIIEVTNILISIFNREAMRIRLNFPASWHDIRVTYQSGLLFKYLNEDRRPLGYSILGDSAFVVDASITNGKSV